MSDSTLIGLGAPAAPTTGETIDLFDSRVTFGPGGMRREEIQRVRIAFPGLDEDSAADGLKGYVWSDGDSAYHQYKFDITGSGGTTLPATVTADDGTDSEAFDIFVGAHGDVKFTYTAAATPPSVWGPVITLASSPHSPL
jgi:hypothetical protein